MANLIKIILILSSWVMVANLLVFIVITIRMVNEVGLYRISRAKNNDSGKNSIQFLLKCVIPIANLIMLIKMLKITFMNEEEFKILMKLGFEDIEEDK